MTAAIRPRRRYASREFARPRRRRVRRDAWAFVPTGGTLESRLRRLLSGSAEDAVRGELEARSSLRNHSSEDAERTDGEEEEERNEELVLAMDAEVPDGLEDLEAEEQEGGAVDEGVDMRGLSGEVDVEGMRCVSQELPLVTSQMSEGLEILLRASQESMTEDEVGVPALCARNDRAARRLWGQLDDAYDTPVQVAGEGV